MLKRLFFHLRNSKVHVLLGPEMHNITEITGIQYELSITFAKARIVTSTGMKCQFQELFSFCLNDLTSFNLPQLAVFRFQIAATSGTVQVLEHSDDALDQIDGGKLRRMALAYKILYKQQWLGLWPLEMQLKV
ncbi:hypothetical protein RND71_009819 [Anisodus tanguticus]|uniref:Uncharacterized protein n=1 Tax=Anisodus tanguticus TaxID=243964 RepID=A0AAE1VRL0_9SOLA|nr:hypothetical protein RND71_009819 [Anisodus tanguticus]